MNITCVVIPAFNEEKYLDKVLSQVRKYSSHIVFVDDGSSDNSALVAQKYTPNVLIHKVNLGKGAALKTGCEYAFRKLGANAVVVMDSDSQHDPKELLHFFNYLKDHQVVLGVRDISHKMPFLRSFWNRSISFLVWLFFGVYFDDIPCGYKGFTSAAYKKIKWQSSDYAVEMEIAVQIAKNKIEFTTLPIETIYEDTDRGMTMFSAVSMMIQIISWRIFL